MPRSRLVAGLALALAAPLAAQGPKDDPLPKGARLRLGGPGLVLPGAQTVTLLPPDYKAFAVPEGHDALRAYDLATARPVGPAAKPARGYGVAYPVVLSADGKRAVWTTGLPLAVREAATGKVVRQLKPPAGFQPAGGLYNMVLVSLSADGKRVAQGGTGKDQKGGAVVWDADTGAVLAAVGEVPGGPAVPVLSADGKRVAVRASGAGPTLSGERPGREVWVYEADGGKEVFKAESTPGAYSGAFALTFSPDGAALAGSIGDGVVDVWDAATGKARPPLLGRTGQGRHVAFSSDGKTLAAVAADGAVQRWAVADGKPLGTTDPPAGVSPLSPSGLAFAGPDRVVAWGVVNSCPVAWEAPSGKVLTPLPEHTSGVGSVAFAAGGKEVLTAGQDGRVVRWEAATGKVLGAVELRPGRSPAGGFGGGRPAFKLSPDGARALSAGFPAAVLDVATGAEEFALPRGPAARYSTSTALSADGTKAVVVLAPTDRGKPAACAVWDLAGRRKLAEVELPASPGYTSAAAVSPSGKRLVTAGFAQDPAGGGAGQMLVVAGWDLETGKKLGQTEDVTVRPPVSVAAAGDEFAVVASYGGRLRVFDYSRGRGGDELEPENKAAGVWPFGPPVFAPDGKRFAVAGAEPGSVSFPVKVYDWPSGRLAHTFAGHRAPVGALAFSPDGKTLATGAQDGTALLWDVAGPK
jgi:WD40 repeat protein